MSLVDLGMCCEVSPILISRRDLRREWGMRHSSEYIRLQAGVDIEDWVANTPPYFPFIRKMVCHPHCAFPRSLEMEEGLAMSFGIGRDIGWR